MLILVVHKLTMHSVCIENFGIIKHLSRQDILSTYFQQEDTSNGSGLWSFMWHIQKYILNFLSMFDFSLIFKLETKSWKVMSDFTTRWEAQNGYRKLTTGEAHVNKSNRFLWMYAFLSNCHYSFLIKYPNKLKIYKMTHHVFPVQVRNENTVNSTENPGADLESHLLSLSL